MMVYDGVVFCQVTGLFLISRRPIYSKISLFDSVAYPIEQYVDLLELGFIALLICNLFCCGVVGLTYVGVCGYTVISNRYVGLWFHCT